MYCDEIYANAANIYLDPLIKMQKKTSELLHSHNIWHTLMIYLFSSKFFHLRN